MTVKLGASSFLLCNVYMPTYQSVQMSYIQEISDVYNDLKALINESSEDHVIIGGDFNTSFNKSGYNTNSLLEFITSEQLMCGLHYEKSAVKFTFESKANGSKVKVGVLRPVQQPGLMDQGLLLIISCLIWG